MKFPWFKRVGIFFVPATIAGWIIFLAGVVFAVISFMDIDGRSHSVSDTMINFVFMLLIIGAVYSLIAFLTTRRFTPKSPKGDF
ncbi:MAG: hypothetical protein WA816_08585 [Bacteroidales bacterium]